MGMRGSARARKTKAASPDAGSRSGKARAGGSTPAEKRGRGAGRGARIAAQTAALEREFGDAAAAQSERLSAGEAHELRTTLRRVAPLAEEAARRFYGRLFELDPHLHYLFTGDHGVLVRRLARLFEAGAAGDRDLNELFFSAEAPDQTPTGSEITAGCQATFVRALLSTLEEALGEAPADEAARAWTKLAARLFPIKTRDHAAGSR